MARQKGAIVLDGKMGGLVFYMSRHGAIARTIGSVSKDKYAKDPRMAARRDAATEFGYAARLAKLLRLGVKQCCPDAEQGSTHNRLTGLIVKVVKEDKISVRGGRRLNADNAVLLEGFEWNEQGTAGAALRADCRIGLDISGGTASLNIDGLVPARDVRLGVGATHVVISLVLVGVDTEADGQVAACVRSGAIELRSGSVAPVALNCAPDGFDAKVLMAGVGLQGYQQVSGNMVALKGGAGLVIGKVGVRG